MRKPSCKLVLQNRLTAKRVLYHKEYMVKDENGEVIWDVANLGGRDEKQANIYTMKDAC